MRKLSALFMVLAISASVFGQSAQKVNREAARNTELQPIDRTQLLLDPPSISVPGNSGSTVPLGTTVTDVVTATKIGEASNAYTFVLPDNNQLATVTDVGLNGGSVAFIYRQNINQCGGTDNGLFRYSISTDAGNSWNIGAATSAGGCYGLGPINPLYTQASRYPNVGLFLPTGATPDTTNLMMVYTGPVLTAAGSGWDGNVHGLVDDITTSPITVQESYPYQAGSVYFTYSLTERVPGEFWYASFTWDGTNIGSDINLHKGLYDASSNAINWSIVNTISPNYYLGFDGSPTRAGSMNIAFSPDGTTGYVAILSDLVGGVDTTFVPCMAATTDGGVTWGPMEEFPVGQYFNRGLIDVLSSYFIDIDTTTGDTIPITNKATTGFDFDLTVDKNGTPHLVAVVGSATLGNGDGTYTHGTSGGYSIFSGVGLFIFDFTKDTYGDWNMLFLSEQATFRGEFGDPAPGGAESTTADPWLQASRSPAGDYIFFSWTDTDTTGVGGNDNDRPDLISAGYDVDNNMVTDVVNWTGDDLNWTSRAVMPKLAPVSFFDKASTYNVPAVIMDVGPPGTSLLNPVSFWYFSNISYNSSTDFTNPGQFFYNCKENPIAGNLNITSPDCGLSDGQLVVAPSGGLGTFSFQWSANAGGVTSDTVSSLPADIYTVTITDSVGCTQEETIFLANANAPTLAITASTDISCAGANDGSATVTPTGGAGSETYLWDNGETTATAVSLDPGTHTCTVTDANGCTSFITVDITEPTGIILNASSVAVDCFGDTNGSVSAIANGGTGALSFAWSSGDSGPSVSGLAGGDYTVVVTDANGCQDSTTVTVGEPAAITTTLNANPNTNAVPVYTGNVTANPSGGTAPYTLVWSGPDEFTDSTNTQFIFGLCGGTYYVEITDAKGCVYLDSAVVGVSGNGVTCVTDTTIGIEDELAAGINSMSMFPNPSNGTFNINVELQRPDRISVEVIDMNGKTVAAKRAENVVFFEESFQLPNVAAGIYMVKVTTSRGYGTRKLIVR